MHKRKYLVNILYNVLNTASIFKIVAAMQIYYKNMTYKQEINILMHEHILKTKTHQFEKRDRRLYRHLHAKSELTFT